jgi:putative hydrolase of the HAD superfamily
LLFTKMNNIEVIFFDLFFTLVAPRYEENEEDNEYYELCISRDNWETAAEDEQLYYERAIGKIKDSSDIIRKILSKGGINKNESDIEKIAKKRIKRFERCLSDVEVNIIETLEYLSKNNKRLCLISNADVIDKIGWTSSPLKKYFEAAIFSCDIGVIKPNRRIYEIALKKMGIEPEKAMFIGDGGSEELRGAKELGMRTILLTHFIKDIWPERSSEYADIVVDKFENITKHIV